MSEKKARIYTVLIKIAIVVFAILFLVLFMFQYKNMINLQNKVDENNSTLTTLTEYNKSLQQQYENIKDPEMKINQIKNMLLILLMKMDM